MGRVWWVGPVLVAAGLTLANAVKPAVVDDTAYLLLARQMAADPFHPYGGELFWYSRPQPAMEILAPPVVPYWLAAGMSLFGEHLGLLKLWLFPFSLILTWAAYSLLRRFARGTESVGVVVLVLSPAVLPLFNFMLDVPAVALGLAAVALFVRGIDRRRWGLIVLAGVVAGLACQTKYTMLTVPAVFLAYAVLHRRLGPGLIATACAVAVFMAWEVLLVQVHGTSHFLYHLRDQQAGGGNWLAQKAILFRPLLGFLGGLATGTALWVGSAIGLSRRAVAVMALVTAAGVIGVTLVPASYSVFIRDPATGTPKLDLPAVVYYPVGIVVLYTMAVAATILAARSRSPQGRLRLNPDTWFLLGWLVIEVAGYFVMTPFPAARRVIPLCVVLVLLAARLMSRMKRARPERTPPRWIPVFALGMGLWLFALDTWDALPERQLAYRASELIRERGAGPTWFQGHWGWQYYCDRLGMKPVVPGRSTLERGDWLIVPVLPDETGFYRPYHGEATFELDGAAVEPVTDLIWDDPIAGQTIPNLYGGGKVPIIPRKYPRLRIRIYRVTQEWVPMPK